MPQPSLKRRLYRLYWNHLKPHRPWVQLPQGSVRFLPAEGAPTTDKAVKLYQIYFNEATKNKLSPVFTPYFNRNCTRYFENDVLLDVYQNRTTEWEKADYVGVVSHKFYEKTNLLYKDVARVVLEKPDNIPVISLLTYGKEQKVTDRLVEMGYPKGPAILQEILVNHLGYPAEILKLQNLMIYRNFWLAPPAVFADYLENFLLPIRQVMENATGKLQELLLAKTETQIDYARKGVDMEWVKATFGRPHYTYHTYVLESCPALYFAWKGIPVYYPFRKYRHLSGKQFRQAASQG